MRKPRAARPPCRAPSRRSRSQSRARLRRVGCCATADP
jgi:hypothetical protein